MIEKIIEQLKSGALSLDSIHSLPGSPGIYAFFFLGSKFPLPGYNHSENRILYIGKSESSLKTRNLNSHFQSGKTGSSTIRRTLGALLREDLKLISIPRNAVDYDAGRTSSYKFDSRSEERLSEWMRSNLGLSFYPCSNGKEEICSLESLLIRSLAPPMNLSQNSGSTYHSYISEKRKETAVLAFQDYESKRI